MSDSKFSNGLILGVIIGGAAVFLFGTPTGRKVLKILSEQGIQGVSDLIETELDERLYEEEADEVVEEEIVEEKPQAEEKSPSNGHSTEPAPRRRRFFKRRIA